MMQARFCMASLFLLVQSSMVCLAVVFSSNITDQLALLAFKSAITFDPNNVLEGNWTEKTNLCDWVGVTCSPRRQRVTSLNLTGVGLHGTISPHLGNLSFLVELDLRNNNFHGHLNIHELGHLRRLKIVILQFNYLEGVIPASLQHCPQLQLISLAANQFSGTIPKELSTLPRLQKLYLGRNNLTGSIPSFFANMSSLELLGLDQNNFYGNIPDDIAHIPLLKGLNLYQNFLTGSIPPSIFNMSSLRILLFSFNGLSGNLPSTTGHWLPNLETLYLNQNHFTGDIPLYLSNSTMLKDLALSSNQFTGTVPTGLGHLQLLKSLYLGRNQLTIEPRSHQLSFLTSLTNLTSLEELSIYDNPFQGILPDSVGKFSSSLQLFVASDCQLTGQIPHGIGSFRNLIYLILSNNSLSGTIPSTIEGLEGLQRLYLDNNEIEGSIPNEICSLRHLGDVNLQNNKFSGSIPDCIGNLSRLQTFFLHSNSLTSSIPLSLWSIDNLLFLNLSFNSLSGSLGPNIRAAKSLASIDLSWNQISGIIPSTMGTFQSLSSLNLSGNSFWGPIPESFGYLITLDFMDLSNNNLSGPIPKSLEALSHLMYLNLSCNKLSGEIPSGGPFVNFTAQSFMNNEALCGKPILQVPLCNSSKPKHFPIKYILPTIASVAIFISLLYIMVKKYTKNKAQTQNSAYSLDVVEHKMFSYQELCHATNNFGEANLIGVGGFASVYKGYLTDGTNIAVKMLYLQLEGASKSFEAECAALRRVRHRNLIKVISACSNNEFRALILEYMPNGNLERWLYSHGFYLNLLQRVSIMLDVAFALEYLHHGQSEPIVHCDLKPSNILLDEDMVAHVGDFGIAKILAENKTKMETKTLGTIGYIAPEYGSEGKVSRKGDIYSYGIMLMEMFTRKKPTDEMFAGDLSLKEWVSALVPHKMMEIVDGGLLRAKAGEIIATEGIILAIMELGLDCCRELPEERSDMKEVVTKLNKIKLQLLCT